jgi:hypothetical protein
VLTAPEIKPVDVPLFQPRQTDKADTYQQAVMRILSDGRWHSAQSICVNIPELDKRTLRTIRDRARGSIIGGQAGYRLTISASKEEVDAYIRMCYRNMREYQQTAVNVENFRNRRRR